MIDQQYLTLIWLSPVNHMTIIDLTLIKLLNFLVRHQLVTHVPNALFDQIFNEFLCLLETRIKVNFIPNWFFG